MFKFLPDSKSQSGFSLIEVLLFLLVVLVLVTILLTSASSLAKTRGVRLESIATEIASCEIEQMRKNSFDSIAIGPPTDIGAPCDQDLSKLPQGTTARRTVSLYQSDSDIKQVELSVDWTENGANRNIKIDTLISKYGL